MKLESVFPVLGLDSLDLAESKLSFDRDLESNISFALSPVFEGANLCAHVVSIVFLKCMYVCMYVCMHGS